MKIKTFTTLIATAFLFCSCGGGGNRQATAANNETNETTVVETIEIVPTDPVIIDIVGNLENKRESRLSDFGSSVRYIRLQPPPGVEFRLGIQNVLSDDEHIIIKTWQGLFLYAADGTFLSSIFETDLEMDGGVFRTRSGFLFPSGDLLNGKLLFRTTEEGVEGFNILDIANLSENANLQPTFQRSLPSGIDRGFWTRYFLIDEHSYFVTESLTAMSIQSGDTLFRIHNYYRPTFTASNVPIVPTSSYRINGKLMMQIAHNDTVFALTPPNRVEPAFVMEWGEFRSDMNRRANGLPQNDRFLLQNWVETQHHIFIEYSKGDGRNAPRHRAIFDKEAKTLTHHTTPTLLFENNIDPVGMPFFPQGINHRGEMYMFFSKEQVQQQIATGKFNNSRLQTLYNRMPDGSFYLMIVR